MARKIKTGLCREFEYRPERPGGAARRCSSLRGPGSPGAVVPSSGATAPKVFVDPSGVELHLRSRFDPSARSSAVGRRYSFGEHPDPGGGSRAGVVFPYRSYARPRFDGCRRRIVGTTPRRMFPAMLAGTIVANSPMRRSSPRLPRAPPHYEFVTLVIDAADERRVSTRVPGKIVLPGDLRLARRWEQMAGVCNVWSGHGREAVVSRHLRAGVGTWEPRSLYLDPDVEVYHRFRTSPRSPRRWGSSSSPCCTLRDGTCPTNGR
jgi:hypothetical protein